MSPPTNIVSVGIETTPGDCGGDARITETRIPAWRLAAFRSAGLSEEQLLQSDPTWSPDDLTHAWDYVAALTEEIKEAVRENGNEA